MQWAWCSPLVKRGHSKALLAWTSRLRALFRRKSLRRNWTRNSSSISLCAGNGPRTAAVPARARGNAAPRPSRAVAQTHERDRPGQAVPDRVRRPALSSANPHAQRGRVALIRRDRGVGLLGVVFRTAAKALRIGRIRVQIVEAERGRGVDIEQDRFRGHRRGAG
jgi:hypothetical protein